MLLHILVIKHEYLLFTKRGYCKKKKELCDVGYMYVIHFWFALFSTILFRFSMLQKINKLSIELKLDPK